jgi:hypothetical protein
MKGIAPSPIPVTAHFRRVSATAGRARASPYSETAHNRLMKNPVHTVVQEWVIPLSRFFLQGNKFKVEC